MSRRIPIRTKLAGALAIPLTALLVVAVLEVVQSQRAAEDVRDQASLATSSIGPNGLLTALMNERNFAGVYLLGFEDQLRLPVSSHDEARQATDQAIAVFRAEVADKRGEVERTYGPALDELDAMAELREYVDAYEGERSIAVAETVETADIAFDGYSDLVLNLFEANSQVAVAVDDADLRRAAELVDLASRQIDAYARLVSELLVGQLTGVLDQPETLATASAIYGQVLANFEDIQALGTGRYREITEQLVRESTSMGFLDIVDETLNEAEVVDIAALTGAVSVEDDFSYYGYRSRIGEQLEQRADELTTAAANRELWFLALAGLALFVAVAVTWMVSRSITRPLRSLTRQAKVMAEERLPEAVLDILDTPLGEDVEVPRVEPIMVRTRDEVADVAEALNTVQDSALDLAVEQAVLRRNIADSFVNLGRRNQNLLGRQLDFITELETNETNPETLADLFRLDHLATRMRRNAESLLVLAGIDPPRKWAAPVRLTDVIRAALGEVEDYQRVTVRGVEPATIVGSAAADLAHLLAELIENALVFSPPDQTVDIRGRARPDSGYTLAIIDSGLGMAPTDIAAANRRLAGAESFTIAPSKYLGHYVAGNLAARHGIRVHLAESPGNGLTAMVDLPATLLTADAPLTEQPPVRASQAPPPGAAPPPAPMLPPPSTGQPQVVPSGAFDYVGAPEGRPTAPADQGLFNSGQFPAAPSDGVPPPPEAPVPPTRTASGLVKRAPRPGAPTTPGASVPDGALLASLSQVAQQLPPTDDPHPPTRRTADVEPWTVPRPRRPEPGPLPEGRASTRSVFGDHVVSPAPPSPGPPSPGPPSPGPPSPAGPPRQVPSDDRDQTDSGLVRRVRGAQLPPTQPISLRRSGEHRAPDGGDYGHSLQPAGHGRDSAAGETNGRGSGQTGEDDSSARNVYSFLTSFTAGVQRGLDESRHGPTTPEDDS
jgi:signal transduction histidine kinase/CHASE3 domain sensor protein